MSYALRVIKDSPIALWPLDESSGTVAYDVSGCGNNSVYVGGISSNILPIVLGGVSGTLITNTKSIQLNIDKNFYAIQSVTPLGIKKTENNPFSIELWFKQNITTQDKTTILADRLKNIGLFYEAGKIVFLVEGQRIDYLLNDPDEAIHIVASYSSNSMKLYINGQTASEIGINNFLYTNTSIDLTVGPTQSASDSFIIDAPAIYRYALDESTVLSHYYYGKDYIRPIQVVKPDFGAMFTISQNSIKPSYTYSYSNLSLDKEAYEDYLFYHAQKQFLGFSTYAGNVSHQIVKEIFLPSSINTSSSKIEWRGKTGIVVESKVEGGAWIECVNGEALPQFKKGSTNTSRTLFIRITMTANESLKILPRLSYFNIDFFSDKKVISENSGDYLYSESEYDLFTVDYPVLLRAKNSGIHVKSDGSFKTTQFINDIHGIEFFYTPSTISSNGGLFYTSGTKFEWKSNIISKSNISKIYVNGVDKTTATLANSIFLNNNLHHVFIIFSSPVSDAEIVFNTLSDATAAPWTESTYKNMAFYKKAVTPEIALNHYQLYIGRATAIASGNATTLSQPEIYTYSNDWIVLQSI
jgi:hypothetical protein